MKKKENYTALTWLSQVIGRKKGYIAVLLLLQVLLGGSSVVSALLMRKLIDTAVAGEVSTFVRVAGSFVALVAMQITLRAIGRALSEWSRSSMENILKGRLFSCLLEGDFSSVTAVHSGEWMNRLTSDTVVVASGLTQILPGVGGMLVKLVGGLVAMLLLEPMFVGLLVPGGLALLLLTYGFRKVLKQLHKVIQEKDGALRVLFQERLGSLMIVRAFGMERQTEQAAERAMEDHRAARMHRIRFSNLCNTGFGVAMNGLYAFGAVFCGYGLLHGTMSYGTLIAILQLISQVQSPFANITGYLPQYYSMIASAERLMEGETFSDDQTQSPHTEEEVQAFYQQSFRAVGLRNVSFTYQPPTGEDGRTAMPQVLQGIDLTIGKGEFVAFTGPSGCGKSTVLKLLLCLYPLDGGERYLCSADGTEQPLTAAWRGLFAYVPQGNQLMSGTIRSVVAFDDPVRQQNEAALWRALEISCAAPFVRKLEQGLDTPLGERGAGLSEGQMQRLAIARAVLSDRPILLLDESTSALDDDTERQLLCNLRTMTDKTVLIVTHRVGVRSACETCIAFSPQGIQVEKKLAAGISKKAPM